MKNSKNIFNFCLRIKIYFIHLSHHARYSCRLNLLAMSNKNNTTNIDALHYDAHNFNAHTEQGRALLKKSVTDNGFGRSIVVDRDNNIIAGNGIVEAAKSLNKKNIRIIDTTGDELVVVRRTDLDIDSEAGRRLALSDNATSAVNLAWDYDELEKARETWNVKPEDWGVKIESEEYRKFVEKFNKEAEKTTDDCYTPQDVYECVRDYFIEEGVIPKGAKLVRPFYPGGDYEREEYPEGCVVYDNPPFSIISKIVKYYQDKGIKFLLYCPALTSLNLAQHATLIAFDFHVIYDNGAGVETFLITNLYDENIAIKSLSGELSRRVKNLPSQQEDKKELQQYSTPKEVVDIKAVKYISRQGVEMVWYRNKIKVSKNLQGYKDIGKEAFGTIYLQSKAQAQAQAQAQAKRRAIIELSAEEQAIVNELSKNDE